jgi:hypothetical protein
MKNIITFNLFEMSKISNFIDKKKEVITYIYTNKNVQTDLNSLAPLLLKKYGKGKLNLFPDFYGEKNEILDFLEEEMFPNFYDDDYSGVIFTLYTYNSEKGENLAAIDLDFDNNVFTIGTNIKKKDENLSMTNDVFKESNVSLIWNKIFDRIKKAL